MIFMDVVDGVPFCGFEIPLPRGLSCRFRKVIGMLIELSWFRNMSKIKCQCRIEDPVLEMEIPRTFCKFPCVGYAVCGETYWIVLTSWSLCLRRMSVFKQRANFISTQRDVTQEFVLSCVEVRVTTRSWIAVCMWRSKALSWTCKFDPLSPSPQPHDWHDFESIKSDHIDRYCLAQVVEYGLMFSLRSLKGSSSGEYAQPMLICESMLILWLNRRVEGSMFTHFAIDISTVCTQSNAVENVSVDERHVDKIDWLESLAFETSPRAKAWFTRRQWFRFSDCASHHSALYLYA